MRGWPSFPVRAKQFHVEISQPALVARHSARIILAKTQAFREQTRLALILPSIAVGKAGVQRPDTSSNGDRQEVQMNSEVRPPLVGMRFIDDRELIETQTECAVAI